MSQIVTNEPFGGVLLLNKSQGMTSNTALQKARRLFGKLKAGHTGTLDPLATGMLPICFGEATKFSRFILEARKQYVVTAQLGIVTDTGDADGEVLTRTPVTSEHFEALPQVLSAFRGKIQQIPPMYSALKHQGTPLYRLARAGKTIDRAARDVEIYELVLSDREPQHQTFQLRVDCSKGTYIRSLVEDIGQALGVGAHVTRLHRSSTSGFLQDHMYSLEALEVLDTEERWACLLPMTRLVSALPSYVADDIAFQRLSHGADLLVTLAFHETTNLSLWDTKGVFFGVGTYDPIGKIVVDRLIKQRSGHD